MRDILLPIFLEEADGCLAALRQVLERTAIDRQSASEPLMEAFRAAHTLKGTGALVQVDGVSALALALEKALEALARLPLGPDAEQQTVLEEALAVLESMVAKVREKGEEDAEDAVLVFALQPRLKKIERSCPPETHEHSRPAAVPIVQATPREVALDELVPLPDDPLAFARSLADQTSESSDDEIHRTEFRCCSFSLAGKKYHIPMDTMVEISELPPLIPLPGAAAYIHGLANLRGRVVTIINLAALSGEYYRPQGEVRLVIAGQPGDYLGFLVDGMPELSVEPSGQPIDVYSFIHSYHLKVA